jgi:hypothetical protein
MVLPDPQRRGFLSCQLAGGNEVRETPPTHARCVGCNRLAEYPKVVRVNLGDELLRVALCVRCVERQPWPRGHSQPKEVG